MSDVPCIQTISTSSDLLYLNFLNNCEEDRIYPPLRLYSDENFYWVDGADSKKISITKDCFEVNINGQNYKESQEQNALLALLDQIKSVNNAAAGGDCDCDERETKVTFKTLAELIEKYPPNSSNEIQLDSKTFVFDSVDFDLNPYKLINTPGEDIQIESYSQAINKLSTSAENSCIVKITNGNLFINNIKLEAKETGAEAIIMNGTGVESLDMNTVEFTTGTKFGTLNKIRQGFLTNGFSFAGKEGFSLSDVFAGGFTILNSRMINVGNFVLSGDATFRCNAIRSNAFITVPDGGVAFDFDFVNFSVDGAFQLESGRYEGSTGVGAGQMVSDFTTGDTTAAEMSRKSFFQGNKGNLAKNTQIGGFWKCTTEVLTPLTLNTPTKLLGTTTYSFLEHLTSTGDNAITHNTENVQSYKIDGNILIDGDNGVYFRLTIRHFVSSTSSYVDLISYDRRVQGVSGPIDVAELRPFFPRVDLAEGDRIELWVTNTTSNSDGTMLLDSFLSLSEL